MQTDLIRPMSLLDREPDVLCAILGDGSLMYYVMPKDMTFKNL